MNYGQFQMPMWRTLDRKTTPIQWLAMFCYFCYCRLMFFSTQMHIPYYIWTNGLSKHTKLLVLITWRNPQQGTRGREKIVAHERTFHPSNIITWPSIGLWLVHLRGSLHHGPRSHPKALWNTGLVVELVLGPLWFTQREKNVRVTMKFEVPKWYIF